MDPSMIDQDLLNSRLDELLRPAFVVEPPSAVQQSILAAVLLAAESPVTVPVATRQASQSYPSVAPLPARTVSPLAYLLLAAVLLAYAGLLSWIHGFIGGTDWVNTMVRQVLVAADLVAGQPLSTEPFALAGLLLQAAPWLLLLPLAWLLWDRDHASAGAG
jgi:hypothetical protein